MATTVAELTAMLSMNNANFKRGLSGAQKALKGFQAQVSQLKNMMLAAFTITGAIATFKKAIASTQGTADKFAVTMESAKEATTALLASIATGDFTGLIENMRNAADAGKEFAEAMDEVADRTRSVRVQTALAEAKVIRLREIATDTARTDKERVEAYKEVVRVLSSQINIEKQIADDALEAQIQKQITRNNLTKEQGELIKDFVTNYEQLTGKELASVRQVERLNKELTKLKLNLYTPQGMKRNDIAIQIDAAEKELNQLTQSLTPLEKKYMDVWGALNRLTDEERDAIANVIIEAAKLERKLWSLKNEAVRGIGAIEGKAVSIAAAFDSAIQSYSKLVDIINKYEKLKAEAEKVDLWGALWQDDEETIYEPDVDAAIEAFKSVETSADSLGYKIGYMLVNQFDSLGNAIGRALSGAESGIEDLGQAILSNLGNILIMAGLQTLPAGLPLVLAGAALQIGSGIWSGMGGVQSNAVSGPTGGPANVYFYISGQNLVGTLERNNSKRNLVT